MAQWQEKCFSIRLFGSFTYCLHSRVVKKKRAQWTGRKHCLVVYVFEHLIMLLLKSELVLIIVNKGESTCVNASSIGKNNSNKTIFTCWRHCQTPGVAAVGGSIRLKNGASFHTNLKSNQSTLTVTPNNSPGSGSPEEQIEKAKGNWRGELGEPGTGRMANGCLGAKLLKATFEHEVLQFVFNQWKRWNWHFLPLERWTESTGSLPMQGTRRHRARKRSTKRSRPGQPCLALAVDRHPSYRILIM